MHVYKVHCLHMKNTEDVFSHQCIVGGVQVNMTLDTGAQVSLLNSDVYHAKLAQKPTATGC